MNRQLFVSLLVCLGIATPSFAGVAYAADDSVKGGAPIRVAWDANPEPVAGYIVHVGRAAGSYTQTFTVDDTTFILADVVAGARYYFAVAAYQPGPVVGPLSEEVSTVADTHAEAPVPPVPPVPPVNPPPPVDDPPAPPVPPVPPVDPPTDPAPGDPPADEEVPGQGVLLRSVKVTGTQAAFEWGVLGGAKVTDYIVEIGGVSGGSEWLNQSVGTARTASATVANNATYYVRVRARTSAAKSLLSNEVVFSTKSPRCSALPQTPQKLVTSMAGQQVTLTWKRVSGATGYLVQLGSVAGRSDLGQFETGRVTATVDIASPGPLVARVIALNGCGRSAATPESVVR